MNPEAKAPLPQPEIEFIIFIDQCSFFHKQLGCIKALNHLAQVSGSGIKVSLGTTDQDYREKTNNRDPQHAEAGITKGHTGFKFAKFIHSNPELVRFFRSEYGKNFIDVFQQEVLQKELLGVDGNKGLLDIMEQELTTYNRRSNNPSRTLQHLQKEHPLFRFKSLHHRDLHDILNGLKEGMYHALKSIRHGNLQDMGINNADDITVNMIRNFIQKERPSYVLQMLTDSKYAYHSIVNSNQLFKDARNHAGENAVFEIEEKLPERLKAMSPEERTQYGKKVVIMYICDDGPAWNKYIKANGGNDARESNGLNGSNPFMLLGAKGFINFMQKICSDTSILKDTPDDFNAACEELNQAKKDLNTQMHKNSGPNGKNGSRYLKPANFNPEELFTQTIKTVLAERLR